MQNVNIWCRWYAGKLKSDEEVGQGALMPMSKLVSWGLTYTTFYHPIVSEETNIYCNLDKYTLKSRQIHFDIQTYTFRNLDKYILKFIQIHFKNLDKYIWSPESLPTPLSKLLFLGNK